MYVWSSHIQVAVPARGQLNTESGYSLSPFTSENLVSSRDGFGRPVPSQPAHSQLLLLLLFLTFSALVANPKNNRTGSGAYSRDFSQFPRCRPFIYLNRLTPLGQSRVYRVPQLRIDGVSLPRVRRHRASSLQDYSNGRFLCITMEQLIWVSLFPHPLLA